MFLLASRQECGLQLSSRTQIIMGIPSHVNHFLRSLHPDFEMLHIIRREYVVLCLWREESPKMLQEEMRDMEEEIELDGTDGHARSKNSSSERTKR